MYSYFSWDRDGKVGGGGEREKKSFWTLSIKIYLLGKDSFIKVEDVPSTGD